MSDRRNGSGEDDPGPLRHAFAAMLQHLDWPMFILTAAADGVPYGCLVGFATQVSIDPPRMLVCASKTNASHRAATTAGHVGVHVVPQAGFELAELFGAETADHTSKFERTPWTRGPHGVPLLDECGDRMVARVLQRVDMGDHTGLVVQPVHLDAGSQGAALGSQQASRIQPGHPP